MVQWKQNNNERAEKIAGVQTSLFLSNLAVWVDPLCSPPELPLPAGVAKSVSANRRIWQFFPKYVRQTHLPRTLRPNLAGLFDMRHDAPHRILDKLLGNFRKCQPKRPLCCLSIDGDAPGRLSLGKIMRTNTKAHLRYVSQNLYSHDEPKKLHPSYQPLGFPDGLVPQHVGECRGRTVGAS